MDKLTGGAHASCVGATLDTDVHFVTASSSVQWLVVPLEWLWLI